jgi:hypothetical protein
MKCIVSLFAHFDLGADFWLRTQGTSVSNVELSVQDDAPKVDIQTLHGGDTTSPSEQPSDPRNGRYGIHAEWRPAISFIADVYLCKQASPVLLT